MKSDAPVRRPEEIELKLALPASDPVGLEMKLASLPALVRRKPVHLHLHNTYCDTPDQKLRQQRMALRLRRVDSELNPQWVQTLRMGASDDSALSQRGEWETAVSGAELDLAALPAAPWSDIDPDGSLFRVLAPSLVTRFDRSSWTVRKPGGTVVAVSLDVGQIVAEDRSVPLCELELELLAGQPATLFALAQQIGRSTRCCAKTGARPSVHTWQATPVGKKSGGR